MEGDRQDQLRGHVQYHQAGLLVYGDDANYAKLGRLSTNAAGDGDEKFEYIYETAGTPRNEAPDSTANLPGDFPDDYFVRITSDGTNISGAYSTDGITWVPVGRPRRFRPTPAWACSPSTTRRRRCPRPRSIRSAHRRELGGGGGGTPAGRAAISSTAPRWTRTAGTRSSTTTRRPTRSPRGPLTITTEPGDIYTGDTVPPPNNFILQSADHAEADWTIETKVLGPRWTAATPRAA